MPGLYILYMAYGDYKDLSWFRFSIGSKATVPPLRWQAQPSTLFTCSVFAFYTYKKNMSVSYNISFKFDNNTICTAIWNLEEFHNFL
jgi:hypothetical protein